MVVRSPNTTSAGRPFDQSTICRDVVGRVIGDDDRSDQQRARVHILRYLDLLLSRTANWVELETDLMALVLRSQTEWRNSSSPNLKRMVRAMGVRPHAFGRFVTAIVALIALGTCLVFAQTSTATILGVALNTSGALVPGVSITVKHTESGLTRTATSSGTGSYIVPFLPVGPYEITTNMPGFKQVVRTGINLVVGQEAVVNLTLEVGANAEQVTVTQEAPLVNTMLSSTSGLITEQQVKDLPLNGRNIDPALNAGVVNNTSNTAGWLSFSVAGHRQENNRFLINGIDWVGGD